MSMITRMSMGQKASAKNHAKVMFAEAAEGETLNTPTHPSENKDEVRPSQSSKTVSSAAGSLRSSPTGSLRQSPTGLASHLDTTQQGWTSEDAHGGDIEEEPEGIKVLNQRINTLRTLPDSSEEVWLRRFNVIMGAVIILNILVIAIETDVVDESSALQDKILWIVIDSLFIMVFCVEVGVRIYLERRQWVFSMWNWFDITIIAIALVDVWIITFFAGNQQGLYILSIFRIVRLVRLVRLVKLVRLLHGLYVILTAFWHAMQTMSFLLAIMLFGLLIYAIFAVNLLGRNSALKDVRINGDTVYDRFGTVYRSMYSLFELMTLEGWEQVARPIVEEMPVSFLFIVSFIMIFTFGMLNMIVALVIEKTLHHTRMMSEHALEAERQRMADELMRVKTLFSSGKEAGAGKITYTEFETALRESEAVKQIFEKMETSTADARELFGVLDWDESGDLTVKEFLEGLQRLQDGIASPWDSLATHAIVRNIKGQCVNISERLSRLSIEQEAWRGGVEARLDSQEKMLQEILARLAVITK